MAAKIKLRKELTLPRIKQPTQPTAITPTRATLQRATVIQSMAFGLMLLPVLNYIAYLSGRHFNWHSPHVWVNHFSDISVATWSWVGSTLLAGVGLLIRRKLAWYISTALLMYSFFFLTLTDAPNATASLVMKGISIFVLASIPVISYFFRFPYLDGRDYIWGFAHRFDVRREIRIRGKKSSRAILLNISRTGALVEFSSQAQTPALNAEIEFDFQDIERITADVVRVGQFNQRGVQFRDLTPDQTHKLVTFLKSIEKPS